MAAILFPSYSFGSKGGRAGTCLVLTGFSPTHPPWNLDTSATSLSSSDFFVLNRPLCQFQSVVVPKVAYPTVRVDGDPLEKKSVSLLQPQVRTKTDSSLPLFRCEPLMRNSLQSSMNFLPCQALPYPCFHPPWINIFLLRLKRKKHCLSQQPALSERKTKGEIRGVEQ